MLGLNGIYEKHGRPQPWIHWVMFNFTNLIQGFMLYHNFNFLMSEFNFKQEKFTKLTHMPLQNKNINDHKLAPPRLSYKGYV